MSYNRYDFSSKNEPLEYKNTALQYISSSRYEGDWKSTPHSHSCTELFYVVSGNGTFEIEKERFSVAKEDIIIINPHTEHAESALHKEPLEYIVLGFESGISFVENPKGYAMFNANELDKNLPLYLQEMLKEAGNESTYAKEIMQNFLEILVAKLLRYHQIVLLDSKTSKTNLENAQIKRYIDHHFSEDITLDTLAELAHLNKYYLVHSFTKEYGISPINYLIQRRLKESKYLLSDTNYSIAEIAQHTGFSSSSYFSQSFNKIEGMSPRQYRQYNTK